MNLIKSSTRISTSDFNVAVKLVCTKCFFRNHIHTIDQWQIVYEAPFMSCLSLAVSLLPPSSSHNCRRSSITHCSVELTDRTDSVKRWKFLQVSHEHNSLFVCAKYNCCLRNCHAHEVNWWHPSFEFKFWCQLSLCNFYILYILNSCVVTIAWADFAFCHCGWVRETSLIVN